jgi:DNA polymerase III beta subunit
MTETALKIERAKLLREADLCAAIAAKNDTVPITRCCLMFGDADGLRLSATDLNHTITAWIGDVEVDEPFTVVVDAVLLSRVMRSLAADEVRITVGKSALTLTSGLTVVELPVVYDAEMFPTLPGALTEAWTLPLGLLQRLLATTEFAMSDLESQITLAGVYLVNGKKTLEAAATNGYMMALSTCGSPRGAERTLFVPKRAVQAVMKLEGESVTVGLTENETHVGFRVGDRCLYTLQNDFKALDFRGQIPKSRPSLLLVDRQPLIDAIRRALVVTEGSSRSVRFELHPKRSRITIAPIEPKLGRSTDQIPGDFAKWEIGEVVFGMNAQYLLSTLESFESAQVRIEFVADFNGTGSFPVFVPADQPELFEQLVLIGTRAI